MPNQPLDCRTQFRLHARDLDGQTNSAERPKPHWILQDKSLRDMLSALAKDHRDLHAAGGLEWSSASDISPEALLDRLGYSDRTEPSGLLGSFKFTAGFVAACTRELFRVQRMSARLRDQARPGRQWKFR